MSTKKKTNSPFSVRTEIVQLIEAVMHENNIDRKNFARMVGISYSHLGKLINGKLRWNIEHVEKIINGLQRHNIKFSLTIGAPQNRDDCVEDIVKKVLKNEIRKYLPDQAHQKASGE